MEMNQTRETINFIDLLQNVRRYLYVFVLAVVLSGLAGFVVSRFFVTPQYEAGVMLIVNTKTDNTATITNDNITSAQNLVDKIAPVMAQRQVEQFEALRTEWRQASSSDQEFGGAKLTENMAVAKKALDAFGTPEFRQLLEQTGMGNHPEVIRTFYRAGKAISEDGLVSGSAPKASRDARSLFPAASHD